MNQANVLLLMAELHIPAATSLKDKRRVVRGIKDRLSAKFNASVAEIGFLDDWHHSVIAVAMVGNDRRFLEQSMSQVSQRLEEVRDAQLVHLENQWL